MAIPRKAQEMGMLVLDFKKLDKAEVIPVTNMNKTPIKALAAPAFLGKKTRICAIQLGKTNAPK